MVLASQKVLRWAAKRARLSDEDLIQHYPTWESWLNGKDQPTFQQLEDFALRTRTAFGYFFLPEPPLLPVPIPDFRTKREFMVPPSGDLLRPIYLCQQRQDWYRVYVEEQGESHLPISITGSCAIDDPPKATAKRIRDLLLDLSMGESGHSTNMGDALLTGAERAGILVMADSIHLGQNDVVEFRGFALADNLAPLVFINSACSPSSQMFSLAHELAHIWLGKSGLSDVEEGQGQAHEQLIERWCADVATELLGEQREVLDLNRRGFFARTSKRFVRALISSTLEGKTLFRDAFYLLGIKNTRAFLKIAEKLNLQA